VRSTVRNPAAYDACAVRRSGGWVSRNTTRTPTNIATHSPATVQSMPRQPTGPESRPPTSGASTGATPPTVTMSVNARAAARPVTKSAITARPITMPPAPDKPWTRRATASTVRLGAIAQTTPARTQTAVLASSGGLRPYRSDSGPTTSWPTARPTRKVVSVSWTALAEASSSSPMAGKPGR
jgi:hypothetical protein